MQSKLAVRVFDLKYCERSKYLDIADRHNISLLNNPPTTSIDSELCELNKNNPPGFSTRWISLNAWIRLLSGCMWSIPLKEKSVYSNASSLNCKSHVSPILKSGEGNLALALFIIAFETSMPMTSNPISDNGFVVRPSPHPISNILAFLLQKYLMISLSSSRQKSTRSYSTSTSGEEYRSRETFSSSVRSSCISYYNRFSLRYLTLRGHSVIHFVATSIRVAWRKLNDVLGAKTQSNCPVHHTYLKHPHLWNASARIRPSGIRTSWKCCSMKRSACGSVHGNLLYDSLGKDCPSYDLFVAIPMKKSSTKHGSTNWLKNDPQGFQKKTIWRRVTYSKKIQSGMLNEGYKSVKL